MKKYWIPIIVVIIIIILVVVFYKPAPKETIKIGAILPLTGAGSALGEAVRDGIEWKAKELENDGYKINVYLEDTQSDPKQAVTAFNKLTSIQDVKIVFTMLSSHAMALKPLAEENKILLWGYSGHPDITKNSKYILRHSNIVEEDARVMSDYLIKKDFKKVGIIYQQDEWGYVWNEVLPPILSQKGIRITSEPVDPKESDFKTTILKIKNQDPDVVVLSIYGPAIGLLVKQLRELEYKGDIFTSPGFITTPGAQKTAGDYAKGMYYQAFEENSAFDKDYKNKFNKEPVFWTLIPYIDMEILAYAIKRTNSTEPEKLIEFIKKMTTFQGKYEKVSIKPSGDIIFKTIIKKWE